MSGPAMTKFRVEYSSNNSGGGWWLSDDDWRALEDAGWHVAWGGLDFCNERYKLGCERHTAPDTHAGDKCPGHRRSKSYEEAVAAGDRWLGALAREAYIEVEAYDSTLAEGVAELWWGEALPNEDPKAEGCNCCGAPHSFWARETETVPA